MKKQIAEPTEDFEKIIKTAQSTGFMKALEIIVSILAQTLQSVNDNLKPNKESIMYAKAVRDICTKIIESLEEAKKEFD